MKHRWIYAGICCMTIAALCAGIPSQSIRADACKGLTADRVRFSPASF